MKHIFTLLFLLFATIAFAQNSQENMDWQYALRFGGDAEDYNSFLLNYPHHLALDNEGNAYVYGTNGHSATYYNNYSPQGQVLFDRFEYGSFYNCSSFLAKFDCNGNVVVNKAIGNYSNYDSPAQYMIMKDNRLFLLGVVRMPVREQNVWFLDTLVYGNLLLNTYISHPEDLVFPWTPNNDYTYLLELDLDGNIVDYNMFSIYKENTLPYYGNILSKNYDMYTTDRKDVLPFAIDNQYNYYMLAQMRCNGPYDSLGNQIPQKMVFKHNDEAITDTIMPEDSKYIFRILKFNQDFDLQYAKPLVVNISDTAYHGLDMYFSDMTCDSDNNLYIAGTINLTYEHGVEPTLPIDVELADNKHLYITNPEYISDSEWSNPIFNSSFIMKMNSDGEILWIDYTKNYGPFGQSDFKSMLIDETSGNIYISALVTPKLWTSLSSSVYTNPYNGYNWTIFGENDTVINNYEGEDSIFKNLTYITACWDTDGNYKWYNCPLARGCTIGKLAIHNNKLYAGVLWSETGLTCEDSTYMPVMQLQQGQNGTRIGGFGICEWDLQGNMTDIRQIYCKAQDQTIPFGTCINDLGEIYTVGRFDNYMIFGEDSISATHQRQDMFIAKFGYSCPTYIYDTATYCYGEVVQGVTLTASGDYTFVYPEGGQEIDSIVLVHATVLPPLTIGLSDTTVCTAQQFYLDACGDFDSYLWSTGGTGCTEMLQFDNACTQSVSLTVTRGECSATRTISITAHVCDGITEPTATAMSLYPNPASDIVSIFGDGFVRATVIDISGRTLLRTTAMSIDISGLRPGEYVVKVERINGEVEELKMVKE